jgi:ribosomal 50S subunit-associated protein YjgA (DUF615 family)
MGPATKQDVQSIVDASRSRVLERIDRVALKQDIQAIMDCLKGLLNVHQQSQQLLRQAEYQRLQLIRRMTAIEARMVQLEQQARSSKGALSKVAQAASQPQRLIFPAQPSNQGESQAGYQAQYAAYRPT